AGYLVHSLKRLHERRIEFEEQLQHAHYQAELRQREEKLAREFQLAALSNPPAESPFEIAVRYEPAREVGGDFYAFCASETRTGVVVGDATGKGIPAALVSTGISHLIRCLPVIEEPERFLSVVHADLIERLPDWAYVSMVIALIEPHADTLVVYNAGHPPALLVHGTDVRRVEQPGLPLGIAPQTSIPPQSFHF